MIEPYTIVLPQPPAAAPSGAGRGERAYVRGGTAGITFDPTVSRGAGQGSARADLFVEGEPTHNGEPLPPLPVFDSYSAAPTGGDAAPFLAQQIAQEMVPAEYVTPSRAAASATVSYRSVPDSRISYDGPFLALDILV